MKSFRDGTYRVLISTDLLARGIDIQQISIVVNYDLPHDIESYLHRIGRSGRFGRKGLAINLVTQRDVRDLEELQKFYNTQIEALPANISSLGQVDPFSRQWNIRSNCLLCCNSELFSNFRFCRFDRVH